MFIRENCRIAFFGNPYPRPYMFLNERIYIQAYV